MGRQSTKTDRGGLTLSASERSRDGGGSSLDAREEGVEDSLTGQEGEIGRLLLGHRTRRSDWPDLVERVSGHLTLELGLEDDVLERGAVGSVKSVLFSDC